MVPSVYYKFNSFRNKVITNYTQDASGKPKGISSDVFDECLSCVWEKFKNTDKDTTLSYIESGNRYSRKELGEILTEADMLMDKISRREEELEVAKSYIKKLIQQKNISNK